ncbi:MAG: hypothetical protein KDJ77_01235, partial [Rhodobiaceae bacterium]|nr:hypothetical protein [Rhodobiaceae bacterium]
MTDEFDRLTDALRQETPPPDAAAKAAALASAMARFEEKNLSGLQGNAEPARPNSRDGIGPSSIWRTIMDALKPSNVRWTPVLAGGASLAVLMLAVISTGVIRPDLTGRQVTGPVTEKPLDAESDEVADAIAPPAPEPAMNETFGNAVRTDKLAVAKQAEGRA